MGETFEKRACSKAGRGEDGRSDELKSEKHERKEDYKEGTKERKGTRAGLDEEEC